MATVVRARFGGRSQTIQAAPGATLRQVLEATDLGVRTGCNGNGSCGLCRVRVLSGEVSAPSAEEFLSLGPSLVHAGERLACQTTALSDVEVEVVNLAPRSAWRPIASEALCNPGRPVAMASRPQASTISRIALDAGTTNLCLAFWSEEGPTRLAALRGPNPQARFGSDVVTRLQAARDPAAARELASAVEIAIANALLNVAASDGLAISPALTIAAVGNTAMLNLLQATHGGLLDPEAWAKEQPWRSARLRWNLGDSEAAVDLVGPLGGFVGSDLLAAAVAANVLDGELPALLIDFGTNTEIALWDGETLSVTSAAGGPAFEASGMHCAVPANEGAIFRVRAGSPLDFEVIGGGAPTGVCGTGLVDWVAWLLRAGILSSKGNLNGAFAPTLGGNGNGIVLSKRDVDLFQRAKAAIGAGVQVLARRAGIATRDLRRVVTTGLFGRGLDVTNAQAVGLLPSVAPGRVETHDNLALAGCEVVLTSAEGARELDALRGRTRLLNLAQCPEFEELFVRGLFLAPMEDR